MQVRAAGLPVRTSIICLLFSLSAFTPEILIAGEHSESPADSLSGEITELRCAGQYAEALVVARDLREVLRRDSTAKGWKVEDVRNSCSFLNLFVLLFKVVNIFCLNYIPEIILGMGACIVVGNTIKFIYFLCYFIKSFWRNLHSY